MASLDARRVPMILADGAADLVPVPDRGGVLARRFDCLTTRLHPTAGHDLPISYPAWCAALILRAPNQRCNPAE
ncbi:MAG: hypothetical protein ACRD0K_05550 [Egibacteraceae bacterium]